MDCYVDMEKYLFLGLKFFLNCLGEMYYVCVLVILIYSNIFQIYV